jgi:hypothetical protein
VLEHERSLGSAAADPVHDQADRTSFMQHSQIPPGFRAWVGNGSGKDWANSMYRFVGNAMVSATPFFPANFNPPARPKNVQSITWGIGNLRVFAISTTDANLYEGANWTFPIKNSNRRTGAQYVLLIFKLHSWRDQRSRPACVHSFVVE